MSPTYNYSFIALQRLVLVSTDHQEFISSFSKRKGKVRKILANIKLGRRRITFFFIMDDISNQPEDDLYQLTVMMFQIAKEHHNSSYIPKCLLT